MEKKIKVVQFGCGPVGCNIARLAMSKSSIDLVGAVDLTNQGKDLGDVAGMNRKLGIILSDNANEVLQQTKPDIVLHATGSSLRDVFPQLEMIMGADANIISTCEELSYPFKKQPQLAAKIDKIAKGHHVTVLATGVNPGFLMDTWPLAMTSICQNVQKIKTTRIQDASPRRLPFQKKIGAGKTIQEFNDSVKAGTIRHVGLAESVAMIAAGLGWELDDITDVIEPVIAESEVSSDFIAVKTGQVAGVKQIGIGLKGGDKLIQLEFQAYIGAKEPYDAVYINGSPDIKVVIEGGVHGDLATAAIVVNSIPRVINASPGLITMKDLPIVMCSNKY